MIQSENPQTCGILGLLKGRELGIEHRLSFLSDPGESTNTGVNTADPHMLLPFLDRVRPHDFAIASAWNRKRLNNMILAVGPGTPACSLMTSEESQSSSDDSESVSESRHHLGSDIAHENPLLHASGSERDRKRTATEDDGMDSGMEEEKHTERSGRKRSSSLGTVAHDDNSKEDERTFSYEDSDGYWGSDGKIKAASQNGSDPFSWYDKRWSKSSMKHGGCINAAAWLTCPWRVSLAQTDDDNPNLDSFIRSSSYSSNAEGGGQTQFTCPYGRAVESQECPTQIITTGDDRLVKFWDASGSMGSISPVSGPTTKCPFSTQVSSVSASSILARWKKFYQRNTCVYGSIQHLATIKTGHNGNVFHLTTVPNRAGKIATCAADGCLHLSDVELQSSASASSVSSTVIYKPIIHNALAGMSFSHHFLDSNTGLLCCDSGLLRFDLRLPAQSQCRESILDDTKETACRSFAVLSSSDLTTEDSVESSYIFASDSGDVGLYDLRFLSNCGHKNKVIRRYRPSCLSSTSDVHVSGIDTSRNKSELLVSYENDQIYTFPTFPERSEEGIIMEETGCNYPEEYIKEFAVYGGHLNRHTFLKKATFAGPNDEYICTGSDSGHAFIYEKATGSVASLLYTDRSTCNGIVPHPSLPLFITYGIDSTAKLWRGTMPVDDETNDSFEGRVEASKQRDYTKSSIVNDWTNCQSMLTSFASIGEGKNAVLPDEMSTRDILIDGNMFGLHDTFLSGAFFHRHFTGGSASKDIVNDLENLSRVLQQNYFECTEALLDEEESPVRCTLEELKRRMSLVRLQHQKYEIGLFPDLLFPWKADVWHYKSVKYALSPFEEADLLPDYPSDWIQADQSFVRDPDYVGINFNTTEYRNHFLMYYRKTLKTLGYNAVSLLKEMQQKNDKRGVTEVDIDHSQAWDGLQQKVTLLKEKGNAAMKQGFPHRAAKYYDKAIVYCALVFLIFPSGRLDFLDNYHSVLLNNGGYSTKWSELLKALVTVRLNLSMAMLKIKDLKGACNQAFLALKELRPFSSVRGKVLVDKLKKQQDREPITTFHETKELEAKAFFRLGSAHLGLREYSNAISYFQKSIQAKDQNNPGAETDKVILQRLSEAKRLERKEKRKQRKKFKTQKDDNMEKVDE